MQKWGNSLAVRIPKAFARETGLAEDAAIDMTLSDGKLVIEPAATVICTLEGLVAGITDENLHGEFSTGPAVGRESW